MTTPYDVKNWSPTGLDAVADSLARKRSRVLGLVDELDDAYPGSTWQGTAATAARSEHGAIKEQLAAQTEEIGAVVQALDAAAVIITRAQATISSAEELAASHDMRINLWTGEVSYQVPDDSEIAALIARHRAQRIADDLAAAVREALSADDDLTAVLNRAVTQDVSQPQTLGDQGLGGMSPEELAEYALTHPDRIDAAWPDLDDDTKGRLGEGIAHRVDQLAHDQQVTGDEQAMADLEALTELANRDPVVATGMYEELGPDGTVAALNCLGGSMYVGAGGGAIANNLRGGLAVASHDPSFDADGYAENMVKYLTPGSDDIRGGFDDEFGANATPNATTLRYLLEGSGYSDDFVRGAARQVDVFEREGGEMTTSWYGWAASGGLPVSGFPPDAMEAILDQFVEHPGVGADFFGGDALADERARFYFGERDWPHDDFQSVAAAVEAISAGDLLVDGSASRDAGMTTARFFDYLPENDNFDVNHASGASPHLANLLKQHMPSVYQTLSASVPDTADPEVYDLEQSYFGTVRNAPTISKDDLDALMPVAVSTQDGLMHIAEGVGAYRQTLMNNVVAAGADQTQLNTVAGRGAALTGYTQRVVGEISIAAAEDHDARMALFTEGISMAADLVPLPGASTVGELGSKLVGSAWSEAVGLTDKTVDGLIASSAERVTDFANQEADRAADYMVVDTFKAMIAAGAVDAESLSPSWFVNGDPSGGLVSTQEIVSSGELLAEATNDPHLRDTVQSLRDTYRDQFAKYFD